MLRDGAGNGDDAVTVSRWLGSRWGRRPQPNTNLAACVHNGWLCHGDDLVWG